MATQWISPTWRMPENSNQSKIDNYSLNYDGTNDYINLSDNFSSVFAGNSWSFSVWLNVSANNSYDCIFAKGLPVQFFIHNNKVKIWLGYPYLTNVTPLESSTTLSVDTWYHVAFTRSGNDNILYINGASDATATSSGSVTTDGASALIGSYSTSYPFQGEMTQVTIYDSALSSAQITALYNSGTPVNPMALTPLPVAYYPLGGGSTGDAADPATTLTVPNDAVPSATVFNFDGTDDWIDAGKVAPTVAITLSMWVKTTQTSGLGVLICEDRFSSTPQRDWAMYLSSNYLYFYAYNPDGSGTRSIEFGGSAAAITDGNWHHVCLTWDGTTDTNAAKMAFDGVVVHQATATATGIKNTSPFGLAIGSTQQGVGYNYNGQMSNVQVWTTGISTGDITTLYNNGTPYTGTQPEAANLKAWWKMNVDTSTWGGSDWAISDSTANYTKVLSRIASDTTVTSAGSADRVNCGNDSSLQITGAMSISLWFRVNTISPLHTWNFVMGRSRYRTEAAADAVWSLLLKGVSYGSPAFFQFQLSDGTTKTSYQITETTNGDYFNNRWQNLTITYDGTTNANSIKAYLNGSLHQQFTSSQTGINNVAARNLTFYDNDVYSYGEPAYTGALSNCAIWNSELSASDVTTIWNGGKAADTIPSTNLQGWSKFSDGTYGSPNTYWTFPDSSSNSNTGVTGTYGSAATFFTEDSVKTDYVSALNGISDGMDTTNLVNSDLTRSIPYSSYSMEFDGTDDNINLGNDASLYPGTSDMSYSFWFKSNSLSSYKTIFGQGATDLNALNKSDKAVFITTLGDEMRIFVGADIGAWAIDQSNTAFNTSNANFVVNRWYHIVFTFDRDGDGVIYIDGVANVTQAVDSSSTSVDIVDTDDSIIGGVDYDFDGYLSNISIYNSVLTQDQVLTIYNGGVPNDISSLSPASWWSLAGDSYYNGNEWICPDLGSGNNNGTSTGIAATGLVGDGPGSTANGIATSMDIPANLKGNAPNSSKNAFSVNMNSADRVTSVPG